MSQDWKPRGYVRRSVSMRRGSIACGAIACAALSFASPARARADESVTARWPIVELSVPPMTLLPTLEARSVNVWQRTSCVPPCTLRLDPQPEYRIAGDGIVDSDPFRLPRGVDRVHVDVSPGSTLARGIGKVFMVGGFLFAAAGGAILVLPNDEDASSDARTGKTVVGVGFLTMGVLTAALGVALDVLSDTSVRIRPDAP